MVAETVGAHQFRVVRDSGIVSTGNRPPRMLVDEYFVLADRRTLARDSRDYGPVRARDVRSLVERVVHAGDGDGTRQRSDPVNAIRENGERERVRERERKWDRRTLGRAYYFHALTWLIVFSAGAQLGHVLGGLPSVGYAAPGRYRRARS